MKRWLSKNGTRISFKHSVRKNRTTFSEIPLLAEILYRKDQTSCVPVPFQQDFLKTFCKWQTTLFYKCITGINLCIFNVFFLTMFFSLMELTLETYESTSIITGPPRKHKLRIKIRYNISYS